MKIWNIYRVCSGDGHTEFYDHIAVTDNLNKVPNVINNDIAINQASLFGDSRKPNPKPFYGLRGNEHGSHEYVVEESKIE